MLLEPELVFKFVNFLHCLTFSQLQTDTGSAAGHAAVGPTGKSLAQIDNCALFFPLSLWFLSLLIFKLPTTTQTKDFEDLIIAQY